MVDEGWNESQNLYFVSGGEVVHTAPRRLMVSTFI
jgi:hypothetical protein